MELNRFCVKPQEQIVFEMRDNTYEPMGIGMLGHETKRKIHFLSVKKVDLCNRCTEDQSIGSN